MKIKFFNYYFLVSPAKIFQNYSKLTPWELDPSVASFIIASKPSSLIGSPSSFATSLSLLNVI